MRRGWSSARVWKWKACVSGGSGWTWWNISTGSGCGSWKSNSLRHPIDAPRLEQFGGNGEGDALAAAAHQHDALDEGAAEEFVEAGEFIGRMDQGAAGVGEQLQRAEQNLSRMAGSDGQNVRRLVAEEMAHEGFGHGIEKVAGDDVLQHLHEGAGHIPALLARGELAHGDAGGEGAGVGIVDRKSTRLNSSHLG